jgi:hypothetical protein
MYRCDPLHAPQIMEWLQTRGGICIWNSANLSNPGGSWTTPARDKDGNQTLKPNWQAGEIEETITDPKDVIVTIPKVVKSFHVATERGCGLTIQVTAGGTRRIWKARAKYPNSWHEFDYGSYENCLILVPDQEIPIADFLKGGVPQQEKTPT